MSASKDMTEAQFLAACSKHGIKVGDGPIGYCAVGGGLSVCRFNGGKTRRGQLAYLLAEQEAERKTQARFERVRALVGPLPACAELLFKERDPDKPYLVIKPANGEELGEIASALRAVFQ